MMGIYFTRSIGFYSHNVLQIVGCLNKTYPTGDTLLFESALQGPVIRNLPTNIG